MTISKKTLLYFLSISLLFLTSTSAANNNSSENVSQIMSYKKENKESMFVIGISVRTSNADGQFLKDSIPLWNKFYGEGIPGKIPNVINPNLLALYTDYEGDYTKPYTFMIGYEVSSLDVIPDGMVGIEIEASPYAVYTTKDAFPQSLIQIWQNVWKSDLNRSYKTDFEVYSPAFNPESNPELQVYIGLED